MILVFEQDLRQQPDCIFLWKPFLFRGLWHGKCTWRIGWGWWSLSIYPEPGIKEFFDYVRSNNTRFCKCSIEVAEAAKGGE